MTHVRRPAVHVHKLPSGLFHAEAASLPVAYSTALICLKTLPGFVQGKPS